jgi:hypothetical protein
MNSQNYTSVQHNNTTIIRLEHVVNHLYHLISPHNSTRTNNTTVHLNNKSHRFATDVCVTAMLHNNADKQWFQDNNMLNNSTDSICHYSFTTRTDFHHTTISNGNKRDTYTKTQTSATTLGSDQTIKQIGF